ncbi:MAG TPA: F0F1 ATP synthase subunit epsilon [Parvibaculum sp.]|jgi:F-type H+-transporting ATPase subunit epsilon
MADKLHFDLVSPERLLLSENVDMVTVPGSEGDFGVLAGHAPVMAVLRPGVINVDDAGRPQQRIFVRGGFAEVTPAGLTILAENAIPLAELDGAALDSEIADAQEDVNDAKSDETKLKAQEKLDHLKLLRQSL